MYCTYQVISVFNIKIMGENKSESEVKGKRCFNDNICRRCTYNTAKYDNNNNNDNSNNNNDTYMCCLLLTPSEYNGLYELIWN